MQKWELKINNTRQLNRGKLKAICCHLHEWMGGRKLSQTVVAGGVLPHKLFNQHRIIVKKIKKMMWKL
jgi:hypothetical protein